MLKKIGKGLKALSLLLTKPSLLNLLFQDNEYWKKHIEKKQKEYSQLKVVTFSELFADFNFTLIAGSDYGFN